MLMGQIQFITVNYTGSTVTDFDLLSTYSDCAIASGAEADLPQPCTLQFKGTVKATKILKSQTCTFSGTTANPNMSLCTLSSSFSKLEYVRFSIRAYGLIILRIRFTPLKAMGPILGIACKDWGEKYITDRPCPSMYGSFLMP